MNGTQHPALSSGPDARRIDPDQRFNGGAVEGGLCLLEARRIGPARGQPVVPAIVSGAEGAGHLVKQEGEAEGGGEPFEVGTKR